MKRTQTRPRPPEWLLEDDAPDRFVPAPEVFEWVRSSIIDEAGPIHNPDHEHLGEATIGFLWTNSLNEDKGRRVLGTAQLGQPTGKPWPRAQRVQQIEEWFGAIPSFLIILDARFCSRCSDLQFCALVEHEMYHCAQKTNQFGEPVFDEEGNPTWRIKGHDVEEFVGVVKRYGAWGGGLKELQRAIAAGPEVGLAEIAGACGVCLKVAS